MSNEEITWLHYIGVYLSLVGFPLMMISNPCTWSELLPCLAPYLLPPETQPTRKHFCGGCGELVDEVEDLYGYKYCSDECCEMLQDEFNSMNQ